MLDPRDDGRGDGMMLRSAWRRCFPSLAMAFVCLGITMLPTPAAALSPLQASLEYTIDPGAYNNSVRAAPTSAMIYPRIAIDRDPASPRDGTIYVVGLQYAPNGSCGNPAVVRSIDGGRTFDAPHVAPLCLSGLSLDVTADNGTLFAASWGPRLLRSTDGGISWEILATIGNASAPASLAVDKVTGGLHLAWSTARWPDLGPVYASSSRDGGQNWTAPVAVLPAGLPAFSPQIAAYNDTVVVGLATANATGPFVAAVTSRDGGATWGSATALTPTAPCLRWSAPSSTVSSSGTFAISWYADPALLPQGCWDAWGNATQTFVSVSVDGGRTFFAPRLAGGPPGWSAMSFGEAVAFDTRSRLYVTWHSIARNWTAASVYVANSTDLGQGFESSSFTTRLQVGGGNSTAQENLALGLNDTVYLLWVAFDPSGDPNRTGIFVRGIAGEAKGNLALTSPTSAPVGVQVRDASTGAIAYHAAWDGSPVTVPNVPPASYEVQVSVGNESSVAGRMPVRTWGRTTFTVHVTLSSGEPPHPALLPWEITAGAALAVLGGAVLIAVQHTRLTREAVLQREVRRLMYRFIRDHPGSSFSQVREAVGLQNGVAAYHLGVLERQGLVRSKTRRRHRWYYPDGDATLWHELPLSPLQSSLLDEVRRCPGVGVRELARHVDRRTSSVAYNVKALARDGVLRTEQKGRKLRCFPADEPRPA